MDHIILVSPFWSLCVGLPGTFFNNPGDINKYTSSSLSVQCIIFVLFKIFFLFKSMFFSFELFPIISPRYWN